MTILGGGRGIQNAQKYHNITYGRPQRYFQNIGTELYYR